jgi:hypothetical protein
LALDVCDPVGKAFKEVSTQTILYSNYETHVLPESFGNQAGASTLAYACFEEEVASKYMRADMHMSASGSTCSLQDARERSLAFKIMP